MMVQCLINTSKASKSSPICFIILYNQLFTQRGYWLLSMSWNFFEIRANSKRADVWKLVIVEISPEKGGGLRVGDPSLQKDAHHDIPTKYNIPIKFANHSEQVYFSTGLFSWFGFFTRGFFPRCYFRCAFCLESWKVYIRDVLGRYRTIRPRAIRPNWSPEG